ncbi:MAG: DUF4126 family protein [Solirubrobacteraceae bacterium]|nr:DUF4126 family protein [Solirubrobacteraceae bacterium]
MTYLLDILQGVGIAAAAGVSPYLPLAVAATAGLIDLGADYDGTDLSFLESPVVLGLAVVLAVVALVLRRRLEEPLPERIQIGLGMAVGAVATAAAVADNSGTWWPGLVVGAVAALVAGAGFRALLRRTRARLDEDTRMTLAVGAALGALVVAVLSVAAPPLGLVAAAVGIWLLVGGRRREQSKHAGLRVLR